MLSRLILLPFLLAGIIIGYLAYVEHHRELSIWLLPIGIIVAGILVLGNEINMWWWRRNPPALSPQISGMLHKSLPVYRSLKPDEQELFSARLSIYLKSSSFVSPGMTDVPGDVHAAILAPAVYLSVIHPELDEWYENYQRIVLYKHPFLTPKHPDQVHIAEIDHEDGVLIMSIEQLIPGLLDPKNQMHLGAYLYAQAFLELHPDLVNVATSGLSPKRRSELEKYLGMPLDEQAWNLVDQLV